jgi:hypothetical protein
MDRDLMTARIHEEALMWSPYISMEDSYKLDDVRDALKNGDTATAAQYGRVFFLTPIAVYL